MFMLHGQGNLLALVDVLVRIVEGNGVRKCRD
jgi:hypothetical protein